MGRIPEGELIEHEDGKVTQGYKSPAVNAQWPHHRHMARLVVEGHTPHEIAQLTGFTPAHISKILGSPSFQAEILRLESKAEENAVNVHEEIKKIAERAVEILDKNIQAPATSDSDKRLQQAAAFDILDRAGYGKTEFHTTRNFHLHARVGDVRKMTTEDLQDDISLLLEED